MAKKRTDEELKQTCNFIRYEILMLHHSMFRMADQDTHIDFDRNAYIESYAIHVRNLVEFLNHAPEKKYIRALDYLDDRNISEWNAFILPYKPTFNKILHKAGIQIAHISQDRVIYMGNKKGWDFEYCNVIDKCLLKWAPLVPKSRIDEGLIKVIKHFQHISPSLLKKILSGVYKELLKQSFL